MGYTSHRKRSPLIDSRSGDSNAVLQTAKRLLGAKRAGIRNVDPLAAPARDRIGRGDQIAGLLGLKLTGAGQLGERTETGDARCVLERSERRTRAVCSQRWIVFAVRSALHPHARSTSGRPLYPTPDGSTFRSPRRS